VTFNEILSQTIAMLHQHGRVSYRALKRQFALADDVLADLTYELTEVHQLAVDQDGTVLVLTGEARVAAAPLSASSTSAAVSPRASASGQTPIAYTPSHLAEKILTSRPTLEGERKQVTVLFADLKGSTELIRDLDPNWLRVLQLPLTSCSL
jgi:hypothetical protein